MLTVTGSLLAKAEDDIYADAGEVEEDSEATVEVDEPASSDDGGAAGSAATPTGQETVRLLLASKRQYIIIIIM